MVMIKSNLSSLASAIIRLKDCRFFKKLDGCFDLLKRNRELVRLRSEMFDELNDALPQLLGKNTPNWAEIAEICRDNQFNSILKELPELPPEETDAAAGDDELDLFSFVEVPQKSDGNTTGNDKTEADLFQQPELF